MALPSITFESWKPRPKGCTVSGGEKGANVTDTLEVAVAAFEDDDLAQQAVARKTARLRQRFRTIRVNVASACMSERPPTGSAWGTS